MPDREQLERDATALLQELIRYDTVNPPGNEQAIQNFLQDKLEAAGFDCMQLAAVDGRPNLVARLPGRSDGPRLCFLGHCDTVLANPEDWTVDPWSGELKDGCVWGRGALDMKDQVACEVTAAVALAEEGWRPESGELMIVVTADEEAGAEVGAKWLCQTHPEVVRCDYVVNEGGGQVLKVAGRRIYGVCVAEKGVFRFTLSTSGRAGHASIPRIGDNALTKLAPFIEALGKGHGARSLEPEVAAMVRAMGIETDNPDRALMELEQRDPRLAILLEPLMGVTFAPTMASASQKINVIPARAHLKVDCRVPPGQGEDAVRAAIAQLVNCDMPDYDLKFDEDVVGNRSPVDTPLMEAIRGFIAREDPDAVVAPSGLTGFTDSRWFREAFPDCVAYGFMPGREFDLFDATPLIHSADERVPVEDLGFAARFFCDLAQEMLG